MAQSHRTLIFAAAFLLLALQTVEALHLFGGHRGVRYENDVAKAAEKKDAQKLKELLPISYTEWLELRLQEAEVKLRRNARASPLASGDQDSGDLPEHLINQLPLQLRSIMRERNTKRNNVPDTKGVPSANGSYMSLCHFKICNMGRKRNNRSIPSYGEYLRSLHI